MVYHLLPEESPLVVEQFEIGTPQNHNLALMVNGVKSMFLASGGNVGIGTTNPIDKLQVHGNFRLENNRPWLLSNHAGTGLGGGIQWQDNGSTEMELFYDVTREEVVIYNTGTGPNVTFKRGGNVGIGTTNPSSKLHVNGGLMIGNNIEIVEKDGNNGTVSCDTFCAGTLWAGWSGSCVASFETDTKAPVSCSILILLQNPKVIV